MFNKIIINSANLINNIELIKAKKACKICAMVKANAYGVGDREVVKIIDNYVDFYGVACYREACRIKNLTARPILIVGPIERLNCRFSYTCMSLADVKRVIRFNKPINVHLKVNTGMNRYGFNDLSEFETALKLIKNSIVNLQGVFTHFATADKLVEKQNRRFKKYLKLLEFYDLHPIIHADNSAVSLKFNHRYDMVRVGFNLYNSHENGLLPAAEIKTKICAINTVKSGELVGYDYRAVANKQVRVAVLPVGYADGFDMHYIGLNLNVGGKSCKVLNVCMDCFMLDISNTNLKLNDEVYILDKFNPLSQYAGKLNTTEYEVMTKFSHLRGSRVIKKIGNRLLVSIATNGEY